MRKLSEILTIGMNYYRPNTGDLRHKFYMCGALRVAFEDKLISSEEACSAQFFCNRLVTEVDSNGFSFLISALRNKGLPNDHITLNMIYTTVIEKLQSEGK